MATPYLWILIPRLWIEAFNRCAPDSCIAKIGLLALSLSAIHSSLALLTCS